ncbi:tRNA pseudouridine(38-40) synthase TruA [Halorarius litoreus]|uniref:tRNA pseudouridine(38-40) synthase TruA n=1 Tax=Halorarius litoreus TaxID=2962676 RepID=UPI0020CC7762|nr:tRNA pseudouridine(38-40) synthase TruA [Halorarius litoreus]
MRAFRLAYDGTGYRGYQRQPHGETVENDVFRALARLGVTATPESPPDGYSAAGRTDAGVSAIQQTVAFEAPAWLTPKAFNGELPPGVRAWASADADEFHAQYDANRRAYEYHLYAPDVDDALAAAVCERLSGAHDFHNLTPDREGTERDLTATCERDGAYLVCRFSAGGFPREFVRRAVGLLDAIVTGDRPLTFCDRVLSDEVLQGPDGVGPAAPEPLLLRRVDYDLAFEVDDEAAASAQGVFDERRVRRQTGARVAARLRSGAGHD